MIFTGCNSGENTEISVKDALISNQELLQTSFITDDDSDVQRTFGEFKDIIIKWAAENDINVESDNENYLVLTKSASGEIKHVESFTFHTSVDFSSADITDKSISNAAAVMTAIGSVQNHGPVSAIFTNVKNGRPIGAADVDPVYLEYDNFIDVTFSKDTALYNTFAANSDMVASKNLDITTPTTLRPTK
jgi:hypothetical protein